MTNPDLESETYHTELSSSLMNLRAICLYFGDNHRRLRNNPKSSKLVKFGPAIELRSAYNMFHGRFLERRVSGSPQTKDSTTDTLRRAGH